MGFGRGFGVEGFRVPGLGSLGFQILQMGEVCQRLACDNAGDGETVSVGLYQAPYL